MAALLLDSIWLRGYSGSMISPNARETQQPAFAPARARRTVAVWRCSPTEKRVVLTAFFLALIWPVYLTVSVGPVNISPARIMALFAIAIVGLFAFTYQHRMLQFIQIARRNPLMVALFFAYMAWRLIADAGGTDPASSYTLTVLDIVASSFFLVTLMVVAMNSTSAIIEAIFWADFIFIVIGLFELVAGFSISPFLTRFSSMSSEQLLVYTMDNYRGDIFRVRALSSHPILFGSYVAAALPVLLHLRLNGRKRSIRSLSLPLIALSPLMLIASNARSALAGGILALLCFYALRAVRAGRRNPMFLALIFFAGTITVIGAMATSAASGGLDAANELLAGRDKVERASSEARVEMLTRGSNALKESPIIGYGDGQAVKVAGLRGLQNMLTIDSYYLSIALNFGYVGFALNALLLTTIMAGGYAASTKRGIDADQSGIAALTAASACIIMCAVTVTSSEYFIIIYALGAISAVTLARPRLNG